MKQLLLFISLFSLMMAHAQEVFPGGVKNPSFWLSSQKVQNHTVYHKGPNYQDPHPNLAHNYLLNGHPAKYLSDKSYSFPLENIPHNNLSVFCVYQLEDTLQENHIWALEQNGNLNYELSSFRFADLTNYSYRNLRVYSQKYPELHSYTQNKDSLNNSSYALQLGKVPQGPSLPLKNFKGILPEFIVYPRVLSTTDKQKVESYLAIKYGINLSQNSPSNYLNSQGQIIWNARDHQSYHYNVFALTKDQTSGLFQQSSSSAYAPTLMSLAYSSAQTVEDLQYTFMSDNGLALRIEAKENAKPSHLLRKWRISSNHFLALDLTLQLAALENRNEKQALYLQIDPLGDPSQESFPLQYTQIENPSQLNLKDYTFDADGNGADILGIVEAPEVFFQLEITEPLCGSANTGSLQTKVEAGQGPYSLELLNPQGNSLESWQQNSNQEIHTLSSLEVGNYVLRVRDAQGHSYEQSFYIQNQGLPALAIQEQYSLIQGQSLWLDATVNMPTASSYQWFLEGKPLASSAQIQLTQAGNYELRVSTPAGCQSRKSFKVKTESADNIKSIEVFPNPSKGDFMVRIVLWRNAPTQLAIYTPEGSLLRQENLGDDNYFLYRGHLDQIGLYILKVQSENTQQSHKLIIEH